MHEKQLAISAYVNLFVQKQRQKEGILQQEYGKQTARLLAEKRDTEERFMQIRLQQTEQLSEQARAAYAAQ